MIINGKCKVLFKQYENTNTAVAYDLKSAEGHGQYFPKGTDF